MPGLSVVRPLVYTRGNPVHATRHGRQPRTRAVARVLFYSLQIKLNNSAINKNAGYNTVHRELLYAMNFEGIIICLVATVMSYFGKSQALPLSTDQKPSVVEADLLWHGQKYCFRYLTMDAFGTENDLKQVIEYGLKFLKEEKETSTNSEISKNTINQHDYSNANIAAKSGYISTNGKEQETNGKFNSNAFSTPALENRQKADSGNRLWKNEENEIRKDLINIIFVSPKTKTKSVPNNDEVVFPTEENLEYEEFTQMPTGVNIFDRADVPAALVASLLG